MTPPHVTARGTEVGRTTVLDLFVDPEDGPAFDPVTRVPRGTLAGSLTAPTGSREEAAVLELLAHSAGVVWQGPARKRRATAGEEAAA